MKEKHPMLLRASTGLNKDLDSFQELYMLWALREIEEAGYIRDIIVPDTIEVLAASKVEVEVTLKTKTKMEERTLLSSVDYTPDFQFIVRQEHPKLFTNLYAPVIKLEEWNAGIFKTCNELVMVDVKSNNYSGKFGSTDRTFQINRTILWIAEQIYINKTIPTGGKSDKHFLFKDAFTPERYLFTDSGRPDRKLHYNPISLTKFLNS
jgi:hypothetical protein